MKKLFFLTFFFVSFFFLASPAMGVCLPCQKASQTETEDIFSDPSFSQSTHNFSSGQMVYVRVETAGGGEEKRELRLLDSRKEIIQTISLVRSGTDPFVYTASFSAPADPGIYYIDIKIEGEGSSFASQRNINVSGVSQRYQVEPTQMKPTATPASSLQVRRQMTPTRIPYQSSPSPVTDDRSWWLVISDFFQRILFYLRTCL